ncbi:MAG: M28 family peptidase [Candidatus Cryptobacteroides sp.]
MKYLRPLILILAITLSAFVAYGLFSLPRPMEEEDHFSSAKAVQTIENISKERHSIIHPEARAEVREYLVARLEEMGARTRRYSYPDVEGKGYRFDAENIVAEFPPLKESKDTTWLLMVAHYDSRYPWVPVRDTTCSYGAADDGYGLAVVLESARVALEHRDTWSQGLRILFTDGEEVGMVGMKCAFGNERALFEDVGLIINVEGRGPFGPALLFETSGGNQEIMALYAANARYPYTFSLTNVVYSLMPNFTDFTVVKDEIPGMNFSTIADVNHYHTSLDNFDFVRPATLQHYGEQVVPVVNAYLSDPKYASRDALRSDKDRVFFTIPLIGLLNFSKPWYLVASIAIFILAILLFVLNRRNLRDVWKYMLEALGLALGALVLGELAAYLGCLASGARFKLFGIVTGMGFDNILMIVMCVLLAAALGLLYWKKGQTGKRLFGTLALLEVLSIATLATLGENMLFLIPLFAGSLSIFLWQLSSFKPVLLLGIVFLCLHAFSFLYALAMALTVGALGAVMFIATLDLLVIEGLCDCYTMNSKD